jgi:hypothetical protein
MVDFSCNPEKSTTIFAAAAAIIVREGRWLSLGTHEVPRSTDAGLDWKRCRT